jgi:enamine deaminase RidA (YjgF/YER057c/UK114 family)
MPSSDHCQTLNAGDLQGAEMEKHRINPWTWQDRFGYSQAWSLDRVSALLLVSGQVGLSSDGTVVGKDDFEAQARAAFENMRTVLERAGWSFADVMKITVYLTDMSRMPDYRRVKDEFMGGLSPASTALGVSALANPELMIEVEAIAVR